MKRLLKGVIFILGSGIDIEFSSELNYGDIFDLNLSMLWTCV